MICCDCLVCRSKDQRNKRLRASVYLEAGGRKIVIDTAPDFREQCLRYNIARVDAVLFTHAHADHVFGFDEIRRFNTVQDCSIPAYSSPETMEDLKRIFDYVLTNKEVGVYRPRVDFHEIVRFFRIGDLVVTHFYVHHGPKSTSGYLFEEGSKRFAYVPDCLTMDDDVVDLLHGVDVMVLDALRHKPHPTHMTVGDSVKLLGRIGAKQSYLTHIGHDLDFVETEKILPANVHLSYDGQFIDV